MVGGLNELITVKHLAYYSPQQALAIITASNFAESVPICNVLILTQWLEAGL